MPIVSVMSASSAHNSGLEGNPGNPSSATPETASPRETTKAGLVGTVARALSYMDLSFQSMQQECFQPTFDGVPTVGV